MKRTITLLLALVCAVTALGGCDKQQNETDPTETNVETVNATEPTEPPTEITAPSTEATEPTTEATEPTTQATEAPTEIDINCNIIARETLTVGQEIAVSYGCINGLMRPKDTNRIYNVTAPIQNGSPFDNVRQVGIHLISSKEELISFSSSIEEDVLVSITDQPETDKYDNDFFKSKVLILIINGPRIIDTVTKSKDEICIASSTFVNRSDPNDRSNRYQLTAVYTPTKITTLVCTLIEVDKCDLNGINTISYFVKAQN